MTLANQTALVTGAGGAIGRAVARTLSDAGARLVLMGRTQETLAMARSELGGAAMPAIVAPCDVTDRARTAAAVEAVLAEAGAIDILVCCAGINVPRRSLQSLAPDDWDRVISTNLTGAFNVIHPILPSMRARGRGLVIQISSVSGLRASAIAGAAYSASKFGQAALGICIGREERGRGIRSTVIYPGDVDTPFVTARPDRPGGLSASRREMVLQPADVAAAVRFVAELPPRVHVPELVLKPVADDFS